VTWVSSYPQGEGSGEGTVASSAPSQTLQSAQMCHLCTMLVQPRNLIHFAKITKRLMWSMVTSGFCTGLNW